MTRSQPGEIIDPPKSVDMGPPFEPQKSKSEYPKAAVGTTKGRSAKVSKTLSHLDFPRVISQARGTPAIKSNEATINPMIKELEIEVSAVLTNAGWLIALWIVGALIKMPMMGGIRIIAKKTTIAEM